MRLISVATLVVAAWAAAAPIAAADDDDASLWRDLVEPHSVEVSGYLAAARELRARTRTLPGARWEVTASFSAADMLRDRAMLERALEILRRAHRLAPDSPTVLLELGRTAEDLGELGDAARALEAYLTVVQRSRARGEARIRLARIYMRWDRWPDAIEQLREAQLAPGTRLRGEAELLLAAAYSHEGLLDRAIAVLEAALAEPFSAGGPHRRLTLELALAVELDRAEQITRSQAVLRSLLARDPRLETGLAAGADAPDRLVRLCLPAADRFYYAAFRHQALGELHAARAAWLAYARAVGGGAYAARALDHVQSIDAALHQRLQRSRRAAP